MKNGRVLAFPARPATAGRDTPQNAARQPEIKWVVSVGRNVSKDKLSIDLVPDGDTLAWEVNICARALDVMEAFRELACRRMGIPSDVLSCIRGQTQQEGMA